MRNLIWTSSKSFFLGSDITYSNMWYGMVHLFTVGKKDTCNSVTYIAIIAAI